MSTDLRKVLDARWSRYDKALGVVQDAIDDENDENMAALRDLREAVRILRCAAHLVEQRPPRELHDAFGAPGDWGYETEIGAALYRVYSTKGGTP